MVSCLPENSSWPQSNAFSGLLGWLFGVTLSTCVKLFIYFYLIFLKNSYRSYHWIAFLEKSRGGLWNLNIQVSFLKIRSTLFFFYVAGTTSLNYEKGFLWPFHPGSTKMFSARFYDCSQHQKLFPYFEWSRWATVRTKDGWFFGRYAFL